MKSIELFFSLIFFLKPYTLDLFLSIDSDSMQC